MDQELLSLVLLGFDEVSSLFKHFWIEGKLLNAVSQEEIDKLRGWQKANKKEWRFARLVREKRSYDYKSEAETPAFFRGVNKIEWEQNLKKRMDLEDPKHQKLINEMVTTFHKEKKAEEELKGSQGQKEGI